MAKIKLVKSAIIKEGKNMCDCSTDVDEITKRFVAILDGLSLAWVGEDSTRFIGALREVYVPSLECLSKRYENHGEYLKSIKNPYESLDNSFGRRKI